MTDTQKIIVISFSVLIFFLLVLLFYPKIRYEFMAKRHLYLYGKKIYKLALYNDYYLINKCELRISEEEVVHLDHLLFGDKFIYVIKDRYFPGSLKGNAGDLNFLFYEHYRPKSRIIPNPLLMNAERIDKIVLFTNLHPSYFINIIVVNDDLLLDDIKTLTGQEYVVKIGQLPKLVEAIEKRDVPELEPAKLEKAVQDMAKIMKGSKHGEKK